MRSLTGGDKMISDLQKRTAQSIINIFETGKVRGDYGNVTYVPGDAGQLTYGRSQTTLPTGNLYLLIRAYCSADGAQYGAALEPFLPALKNRDPKLNTDANLKSLLHSAGADPVMQNVQDEFFDRIYWAPAAAAAQALQVASALGMTTVYDSVVHGAWKIIRDKVGAAVGAPAQVGEHRGISSYIQTRRAWLAAGYPLLRKTVYRMDALRELCDQNAWELGLPLRVRGLTIDESTLGGPGAPVRVSAQIVEERMLQLQTPYMQGDDVKALQAALVAKGATLPVDGVFGPDTEKAVLAFQSSSQLVADGVAGPATKAALGLD